VGGRVRGNNGVLVFHPQKMLSLVKLTPLKLPQIDPLRAEPYKFLKIAEIWFEKESESKDNLLKWKNWKIYYKWIDLRGLIHRS
jgi:hypothetical protein